MVLKLNGIAGISVKDKLGGKKKKQRKGKVMARKIKWKTYTCLQQ